MKPQLRKQLDHDDLLSDLTRELRGRRCMACGGELQGITYRGEELAQCCDCGAEEPIVPAPSVNAESINPGPPSLR